ncbi:MAG: Xaa-Pro dipeptidase, partial [Gammaproteobacteria bacterium]
MKKTSYDAHVRAHKALYNRVLTQAGLDAIVVYAGRPGVHFLDDNHYPFKVSPLFKAWLPVIDAPDSFIVLRAGQTPTLIYCQPVDYWHAVPADPDAFWADRFNIEIVNTPEQARALMPEGKVAFLGEAASDILAWGFSEINPERVLNTLHYARAWKSEYELECLTEATRIGVAGHRAARDAFETGASEFDIHLAYAKATGLDDHTLPYQNIIALNEHAAILHYMTLKREAPAEMRSFLIDAGGSCNGYASDITRTYTTSNGTFADLILEVDTLQQDLCNQLKPGLNYVELHERATLALAQVLERAQIIHCSAEEAVASGLATCFFPHGLGHYLGLQVHDVGGFMGNESGTHVAPPEAYPTLRLTRTVEASHVMTI